MKKYSINNPEDRIKVILKLRDHAHLSRHKSDAVSAKFFDDQADELLNTFKLII